MKFCPLSVSLRMLLRIVLRFLKTKKGKGRCKNFSNDPVTFLGGSWWFFEPHHR